MKYASCISKVNLKKLLKPFSPFGYYRYDYHNEHFLWFVDCLEQYFQSTITHFIENYIPGLQYVWTDQVNKILMLENEKQKFKAYIGS